MASERNIVLKIKAEYGSFKADMAQVAKAAEDAAQKTEQSGARASTAMGRLAQDAQKNRQSWETAGTAITAFGAVAVAGVGLAITKYAQFEKAMSRVQAATHESAGNMDLLRDAAMSAGADTAYSAEEAAGAIEELAKAGVSTKDILGGGLTGALSLAAAGEMEVGAAAETAASAMTQFKLSGDQIPHIADLLSAGAGKAQGSVSDLSAALGQTGLVAAGAGLSLEETVGGLAAFASAGLVGSDAGTSFKTMLQRLNPQSEAAAEKMAELGISAYDSEGNFIGLEAVAGKLQTGMSGLSEEARASAMNIIFGSDAVRAANVLYEQGAAGIAGWTDAVDTAGYAALTASINQDNLLGDLEKLGGALDTVFIKGGSGASGALRGLVQGAEDLVDAVGRIPEPVLSTGFALAGIVGGAALVVGGFMRLAPAAVDMYQSFRSLGDEGGKLPGTLGKIAKGAGLAAAAVAGLQIIGELSYDEATVSTEQYASALLKVVEAGDRAKSSDLDSVFAKWGSSFGADRAGEIDSMAESVERFINKTTDDRLEDFMSPVTDFLNIAPQNWRQAQEDLAGIGDELGDLASNGGAEAAAKSFNLLTKEFEANGQGARQALDAMPGYRDALLGLGNAAGVALTPTELLEFATGKIPTRMQEAQDATALAEAQYGTYATAAGGVAPVTEEMAKALEDVGLSADGTIVSLEKFVDLLLQAGLSTLSARDASRGFQEAIDGIAPGIEKLVADYGGLGEALNDTGTDFNEFTAAGRDAGELFDGLASKGASYTQALADAGASQEEVTQSLQGTYDSLIVAAGQFGITGEAADSLARNVMEIPKNADIATYMDDYASGKVGELTGAVQSVPTQIQVNTWMDEAAKLTGDATRQSVDDVPDQALVQSWMSDSAFQEALRTRAAALNIPEQEVIDSFMSSAARNEADNTTASVLGIPVGASVSSFMASYARAEADSTAASVNSIPGYKEVVINTVHRQTFQTDGVPFRDDPLAALRPGGLALGGRVPALATGGRLPTSGPGTDREDGILGISATSGLPTALVDAGEWVINGRSSDEYDRELAAINAGTFPKLRGYATGGRIDGLRARPGEENWQWQSRQQRIVEQMADVVGQLADWEIQEDGSGWIRTMDNTMIEIADGSWRVSDSAELSARAMGRASEDARWAGETAKAAGESFQGAGFSANATAGTFTVAGQVTQQAAQAIIAATAAVNAAGQQRAAAEGGGLRGQAGETNAVWRGRQDQFEQSISQQFGGLKYSEIHEDGSGQMELDDGRLIELDNGRWRFVRAFKYGWGPQGPRVSKYAGGGRLPTSGPGTEKQDGFLGISSMTGQPSFLADGGEWMINSRSSAKHHNLLSDVNRDAPWLADIQRYANGARSMAHGYAPSPTMHSAGSSGAGSMTATVDTAGIQRAVASAMSGWTPMVNIDGVRFHGVMNRQVAQYGLPAARIPPS